MVRRNFLEERRHKLNVAVSCSEGTERPFNQTVERTRHEAVGLAEHDDLVATIIGERLHPDTVLLVSTRGPGVLFAELVRPGDALILSTECEGALATITTDHIRKGVGLRAEDRRVGAVLVTELRVDGDAVQLHVAIVVRSTRVTTRGSHVHVTGDQALTNAVSVGQVRSLGNTTASDHVGVNDLILIRNRRIAGFLLLRHRSWCRLCLHHHGAGGCQRQDSHCARHGLHLVGKTQRKSTGLLTTGDRTPQIGHVASFRKIGSASRQPALSKDTLIIPA